MPRIQKPSKELLGRKEVVDLRRQTYQLGKLGTSVIKALILTRTSRSDTIMLGESLERAATR